MDEISTTISKEWIGLIILPTISSVAGEFLPLTITFHFGANIVLECITAVKVSVRDELTLSISVAVGSTIVRPLHNPLFDFKVIDGLSNSKQTALFVIP